MPFGILPKTLEGRHYEGWYVGGGSPTAISGYSISTSISKGLSVWDMPIVLTSFTDDAKNVSTKTTATMWVLPKPHYLSYTCSKNLI